MEPEKVSEALTEYTIFDNPFMRAVFKDDEDVTQLVLQINTPRRARKGFGTKKHMR